jgi:hypothetical protein
MGELLGLGITHQPSFLAAEIQALSLRRALQDPDLPDVWRSGEAWPEKLREEWASDQGAQAAARHREAVVGAIRSAREVLDEFAPDVVVIWGDDQYENFLEDLVPAFCVMAYDVIEMRPFAGVEENVWGDARDTAFHFRGHRDAGRWLSRGLLERGFDVAYSYAPLHHALGHAFANSLVFLDWDRRGFPYPVVPFHVNCYGRLAICQRGRGGTLSGATDSSAFDPPSPSPRRCWDLGAACATVLRESPWRVALVASSSWSHAFLTRKNYHLYPDEDADRELYEALRDGDYGIWRSRTLSELEVSGQQEMLNWYCLVGAMDALGRRPDYAGWFASAVANSNKVVAWFKPQS